MIELGQDKRGGDNTIISGAKKESWCRMKWKMGLTDRSDQEPKAMTWNNGHIEGRIESRLDRIYISEG
eukprot:c31930_g1_i1 orf=3-206(+)